MSHEFDRYESGMMLPPVTQQQRWIEAQRIMADIIDQSVDESEMIPGSKMVYTDGTWTNNDGYENDFTLERYMGVFDRQMQTTFRLCCDDSGVRNKHVYYVNVSEEIDVVCNETDGIEVLHQRRSEICRILATVAIDSSVTGIHYEFERMVTAMAAQEVPIDMNARMLNWEPEDWDDYAKEYLAARRRHRQSRINPIHLAAGSFNSRYQLQIESSDKNLNSQS